MLATSKDVINLGVGVAAVVDEADGVAVEFGVDGDGLVVEVHRVVGLEKISVVDLLVLRF